MSVDHPSSTTQKRTRKYLYYSRISLGSAILILLYVFYVNGLGKNPPGFYIDESALSYNAYRIYLYGQSEHGDPWPLYFPIFRQEDGSFAGYANPTYIYTLAALYYVFPPSILLTRYFSATIVFLACVLLGLLSARIAKQPKIGILVGLSALLTPWLFELSRLVFEAALYPLVLVLFLTALYRTHERKRATLIDFVALAITLALATYTYTIGRLLGPMLAIGLLSFATNVTQLRFVIKVWMCYGLTLIPLLVFVLGNPGALGGRFSSLTYVTFDKPVTHLTWQFIKAYAHDIGPGNLLISGDPILRHHVPGMGMLLLATLILAVIGVIYVIGWRLKDPWWRFIFFGFLVSVLPGALTVNRSHMLRLIAVPLFLLLLTVPALMWLLNTRMIGSSINCVFLRGLVVGASMRRRILLALVILTLLQALLFQIQFRREGPRRGHFFDSTYPRIFEEAMSVGSNLIYLVDSQGRPAYIHAYWYATVYGHDTSRFIHLTSGERPPTGALVISTEQQCRRCQRISRHGQYILYRAL